MSVADNKNVSRFYSLALGKYKNFNARTDGLIAEASATPDVSQWSLLYANNSSTVVITNLTNGCEGQIVQIINVGSDLSFSGSNFQLTDSSNIIKNDNISFLNHSNVWYETGRSHSAAIDVKYAIQLSADNASIVGGVANTRVLVINNSGATTIAGLSGGYVGQILTIVNTLSNVTLSHNALLLNQATGGVGFVLQVSGVVTLLHMKDGKWLPVREAYTGANPA